MKTSIDINCDVGESYGKNTSQYDKDIMPYISSCNIACGFHSGDPLTIERTIKLALKHNVKIGAHPSFPDLQGFGRRVMNIPSEELRAIVRYQIAALKGMVKALGGKLHHIKPHGALYNLAAKDEKTAEAIVKAIVSIDDGLILYGLSGSLIEGICNKYDLQYAHEAFADRNYEEDGSLRSRQLKNAVIHDEKAVVRQVKMMIEQGKVIAYTGEAISLKVDTICIHSDTKDAAQLAAGIHKVLKH